MVMVGHPNLLELETTVLLLLRLLHAIVQCAEAADQSLTISHTPAMPYVQKRRAMAGMV